MLVLFPFLLAGAFLVAVRLAAVLLFTFLTPVAFLLAVRLAVVFFLEAEALRVVGFLAAMALLVAVRLAVVLRSTFFTLVALLAAVPLVVAFFVAPETLLAPTPFFVLGPTLSSLLPFLLLQGGQRSRVLSMKSPPRSFFGRMWSTSIMSRGKALLHSGQRTLPVFLRSPSQSSSYSHCFLASAMSFLVSFVGRAKLSAPSPAARVASG